jgi:hypothetical protein
MWLTYPGEPIRNRSAIHFTVIVVFARSRVAQPVRSFFVWLERRRGAWGAGREARKFERRERKERRAGTPCGC